MTLIVLVQKIVFTFSLSLQYNFSESIPYFFYYIDDLSENKDTLQKPKFPGDVITPYAAHNAVDRNVTTCMRTDNIGTSSKTKQVWWKVDLGGVYNIYSINILFRNYPGKGIYSELKPVQRYLFIIYTCIIYF